MLINRLFLLSLLWVGLGSGLALLPLGSKVLVCGATGRVGRLCVNELLGQGVFVKAVVRDEKKAANVLPIDNKNLEIVKANIRVGTELKELCADINSAVWCATGFTDKSGRMDKLMGLLRLKFRPQSTLDIETLASLGRILADKDMEGVLPQVVVCSSAGVTRPSWTEDQKEKYPGAADIPIVRLNPFNILGVKREGEDALRSSGCRYTVVRPTGLNDDWPRGRPVLSQGDLAVGRISRADVAALLVSTLGEPAAVGKTFEACAVPGYPFPNSYATQLGRLAADSDVPGLSQDVLDVTYALLQQLVPGEILKPEALAMGQKYEELDAGMEGRLGKRGEEKVPIVAEN